MHSHLIPGIDDGAKNITESLELLRGMAAVGFRKVITTPHIMGEYYPNSIENIQAGLEILKKTATESGIEIEIAAAAEYFVDDYFETLLNASERLLTFSGNHLLIEFSTFAAPPNFRDIVFQLTARGYQPVLAHPERYTYFAKEYTNFEALKRMGCLFQVNLLSLTGYYGTAQKQLAVRLLQSGWVDFLGSDLHKQNQLDKLTHFHPDRSVRKLLNKLNFKNENL